ncbi:hemin uptake protein HemP [Brucella gallinifaecis]|uniref:Hemin uptake protein HemP n=1 Tax=Brucella gallinifaecis TaxID=215590 RepID=A0A502BUZ0_9HYPH|nr:hemin uptake protein HemP [Brucella gallinifaecis]TPF76908.1 hemin uptake protein HemP [Brucella gallinifaecis]
MNRRIHIDMQVQLPRERVLSRMPEIQSRLETTGPVKSHTPEQPYETQLKTYGSRELFNGSREVAIEHGGSLYRLKITRQGKLILNK